MTALLVLTGLVLVTAVGCDVFRTALLPSSTGGALHALSRGLWHLGRRMPARLRPAALRCAGPLALVLTVVVWLLVLVVGFACFYLPGIDELAFSGDVDFPRRGPSEALYLSGAALLTLGFGDIVGQSTLVRLLTVAEAAAGLGVLTATLGYLPAIYTLVSELRSANQAVADLGADEADGAAELLGVDASLVLDTVRRDVIVARQHLQRFPVLHYFHPKYDESVIALLRGATSLWVAGHFADDEGRPLHRHEKALEQALRRLSDDLVTHGGEPREQLTREQAEALFEQARAASAHPEAAADAEVTPDAVALLQRLHGVVDAYAARHDYPPGAHAR